MESEPKPQTTVDKPPEKPHNRRHFLKIIGLALVGANVPFLNLEGTQSETEFLSKISVTPEKYRGVVVEAYKSLPPKLKIVLRNRAIEVTFRDGDVAGGAAASDQFGLDISVHGAYVRWPVGVESVSFPWGDIKLVDAIRHEISHIALERIFQKNSQIWVELIKALREEGPEFLKKATAGHGDVADLYSPSSIASYNSLHEYLASLVEHKGRPVRVPFPSGRARPMVEALGLSSSGVYR